MQVLDRCFGILPGSSCFGVFITAVLMYFNCGAACASTDAMTPNGAQPWSAANSIRVRYFVASQFVDGEPIHVSPDGKHLFITTRRGDLASDTNLYELQVFAVSDFARAYNHNRRPAPIQKASFATATNQPGISDPRWVDGGRGIALLGVDENNSPQVYRLAMESGDLIKLTNAALGIYSFDAQGSSVIYFARSAERGDLNPSYYPGKLLDRDYIAFFDKHWINDTYATFVSFHGAAPRQVGPTLSGTHYFLMNYWLSPDGRWAIMTTQLPPGPNPVGWDAYGPPRPSEAATQADRVRAEHLERRWEQFLLVDIKNGTSSPLFDAPTGYAVGNDASRPEVLWEPDNTRVVIFNTCLPLDRDLAHRRETSFIVEYDVKRRSFEILDALPNAVNPWQRSIGYLKDAEWLRSSKAILVRYTGAGGRVYKRDGTRWTSAKADDSLLETLRLAGGYKASIQQSANDPPTLVVTRGTKSLPLLGPDPALERVQVCRVETFQWKDARGKGWLGGLSLPPQSKVGNLAPLVIQLGNYDPKQFRPDGSATTAYAAQALNSQGFAVLRARLKDVWGMGTPEEGPSFLAGLDAAVEELRRRRIVDSSKVGLIGFSRAGYVTQFAVTHPSKTKLGAAVAADSFSGGYFEYMNMEDPVGRVEFDALYGGQFWQNKSAWLDRAPTFNADKSLTPLLLTAIGPMALLGTQELFASLQFNNKPVDLMYFPEGEHQLVRPAERLASLESTVDWMSFWLKDQEDVSLSKAQQNARWRQLRSKWRNKPAGPIL